MDKVRAKHYLETFNFQKLFFEELGWDEARSRPLHLTVFETSFELKPVAKKREFQVFQIKGIPEHKVRQRLERDLNQHAAERLLIFTDDKAGKQLWQWARVEKDKPLVLRTETYNKDRSAEALLQKLEYLEFSLSEEDTVTTQAVRGRTRRAFDVERVTKQFYEKFQKQHGQFYKEIQGLPDDARSWYTSLMLNRLMFIYFVQKKGFLDDNVDYLRDRLTKVQAKYGSGKFQNFYQHFLLALFHEGLGKDKNERKLKQMLALLGNVPYLNGGLFEVHQLEDDYKGKITVPDEAFEAVFSFFEGYQWHLDDRPLSQGNEINPDVLGYIFEKYINQKQMGAYYTKEDITEYISKNTVLPYILQTVANDCQIAFTGERSVWRLLAETPDRYIYPAVRHGADQALPKNIEAGIKDVSKRTDWNQAAPDTHALPTEIWREVVARRTRYQEVKAKLEKGEVNKVEDLITLNLNIRQFTQDALDTAEGSELVKAFWKALTNITILDPTCGSGAFLFAALNILQPLYEAALDKMQSLVNEADATNNKQKYADFRKILAEVAKHPNERYFVLKTIVVNNLYGVDIMEEATEIVKLRLFLKLMSQVETPEQIEPLPDVDFNIRAGNALVGFATEDELDKALSSRLDLFNTKDAIKEKLDDVEALFKQFRLQQTEYGGVVTSADKQKLRKKLSELEEELNRHLAAQYLIDPNNKKAYGAWKTSHQPFHWFVDFYSIMKKGGFDAIIGNPPYIEYSAIRSSYTVKGFRSTNSNLYALISERALNLLKTEASCFGFIVPISLVCTQRMQVLQEIISQSSKISWFSNYAERPSKLFTGAEVLLTIVLSYAWGREKSETYSTGFTKWASDERSSLFNKIIYNAVNLQPKTFVIPKVSGEIETSLLSKLRQQKKLGGVLLSQSQHTIFYRIGGGRYWKIFTNFQPRFVLNGKLSVSSRENNLYFATADERDSVLCVLSSNLFYWYFILTTNCRDLNPIDLTEFPFNPKELLKVHLKSLVELSKELMNDYQEKSVMKQKTSKITGEISYQEFYPRVSKPIIDQIDQVLAKHYGFTDEELDFIINYDIKYRMGQAATEDEE